MPLWRGAVPRDDRDRPGDHLQLLDLLEDGDDARLRAGLAVRAALRRDALTDYQFGKMRLHHLFCSRCGIRSFGRGAMPDGTPIVAVNVRCLDDVDLAALPVKQFDGKGLPRE